MSCIGHVKAATEEMQYARCVPHAGVTDARDRIDYEGFSSTASAAGAARAAGSASRPSAPWAARTADPPGA